MPIKPPYRFPSVRANNIGKGGQAIEDYSVLWESFTTEPGENAEYSEIACGENPSEVPSRSTFLSMWSRSDLLLPIYTLCVSRLSGIGISQLHSKLSAISHFFLSNSRSNSFCSSSLICGKGTIVAFLEVVITFP
jgi:hypothetical protein